MNNYKIIDNFLDKKDFINIKNNMESYDFPYYLQKEINSNHDKNDLTCYFTHALFGQNSGFSNYFHIVQPLITKLKAKALIRVKANIYLKTEKVQKNEAHIDYDFEHKGAIFSINTNNGGTILDDNTKIDSIENRILFFDPSKKHSSTTTSNAKFRMNININYL
jgi:hypothetical protein|tara:strand:- start:580 stop:1071 length:492 start_codon:yes stop_codon:yes gene_type:complete